MLAIGIDVGGTRTKAGLVDLESGKVVETTISPTEKNDSGKFLASIVSSVEKLKGIAADLKMPLAGVGFGVSSFVFPDGLVDSTYGFLPFMEDYPLKKLVEENCHIPCRVDNDARVVALGEALYGSGRDHNRVLVLTLGTGLGVGFIAEGMFESPHPYGHMGGHIKIRQANFRCYCGKEGCLESLVSATGFEKAAEMHSWNTKYPEYDTDAETFFREERNGNPEALAVVRTFINDLKTGISNYINLFAPDIIILGGGISKGLYPYLDDLKPNDHLKPYKRYIFKLALSELEEHSGILGGAALFRI
jgi:glucokinase